MTIVERSTDIVNVARGWIKELRFEPMTDEEVRAARKRLGSAMHSNAMEFQPLPEWMQEYRALLVEERVPAVHWRDLDRRLMTLVYGT